MKTVFTTQVLVGDEDDEETFEFQIDEHDVVDVVINGKHICSGDWSRNFKRFFHEILFRMDEKEGKE